MTPAELAHVPAHSTGRPLRQAAVLQMQQSYGNALVQRLLAGRIQRKDGTEGVEAAQGKKSGKGANPGGKGPGKVTGARETFYEVSGAALDEVSPQLNSLNGVAAETNTPLGLSGDVKTKLQEDGTYRAKVTWKFNDSTVTLPKWTEYNSACEAAQTEWDRFMGQLRRHEQEAHVNAAQAFLDGLGEGDRIITGTSTEDVQANLVAKKEVLAAQIKAIHDGCDKGVELDAILHPDNGHCPGEEEEEGGMMASLRDWLGYFGGGASEPA
jgi:predicted secreted Zn-dependent protease